MINLKKKMFIIGVLIFFSSFVCISISAQITKKVKKKPEISRVLLKPDLQVHKISVLKTGNTSDGDNKVSVKVILKNISKLKNCSGPFKIKLEWRKNKKSRFRFLRNAGIANLCFNPAHRRQVMEERTFDDTVPKGESRYYRATIDYLNQVTEANENNNQAFVTYKYLRPFVVGCIGVDLVLKKVEIKRTSSGVFLKAFVKNKCRGRCNGSIEIAVDESAIPGGDRGLVQPIGVNVEPNGEYENSWVGIRFNPDGNSRYTVTAKLIGCIDRNLSNNTCVVTLRHGANEVTKNCH